MRREEIVLIRKAVREKNQNLMKGNLREVIKGFSWVVSDLPKVESWEWELVFSKLDRNSKDYTSALQLMAINKEYKELEREFLNSNKKNKKQEMMMA